MVMPKKLKFYAVTHDILGDVFWDVFRNGLFAAAARYDVNVEHLRPGKFSPEIQASLLASTVASAPDGLISTIPDVKAVEKPLCQAVAAGIPLICVNAKDARPRGERIPYDFYIGGDDGHSGEIAGQYIREHVAPRSCVCVDHYLFEHVCHSERWTGFKRFLESTGIPAQRLRIPGGDAAASAAEVADFLRSHPDCDAVLTLGPPGAQAVLNARALLPATRTWQHLTFDVAKLQLDGIRSGAILATIDSQQYLQGYLAVAFMYLRVTSGFKIASDIYTGPSIVDGSSVEIAEQGVVLGIR